MEHLEILPHFSLVAKLFKFYSANLMKFRAYLDGKILRPRARITTTINNILKISVLLCAVKPTATLWRRTSLYNKHLSFPS